MSLIIALCVTSGKTQLILLFLLVQSLIRSNGHWRECGNAKHLKLYNSGSFFDGRAIPEEDYPRIASLVSHFETVIVESHPKLIGEKCLRFRDMLKPELQVAMGLETVNPDVLLRLNKKMTLQDFAHSVSFLNSNEILSRAFILLRPPFLSEEEGFSGLKDRLTLHSG